MTETTKICKKCGIEKSLDLFYNASERPDKKEATCIPCRNLMTQEEWDNRKKKQVQEPVPVTQPGSAKRVSRKEKPTSVTKDAKKPTKKPKTSKK